MLNIGSEADYFIDRMSKSYHVAREQSKFLQEHLPILPSLENIQILCDAIIRHGRVDAKEPTVNTG